MRFYNRQHRHYCGIDLHVPRGYAGDAGSHPPSAAPGAQARSAVAHIQNTRAQYNLPAFGRRLAYPANREGVREHHCASAAAVLLRRRRRSGATYMNDLTKRLQ